MRCSLAGPLTSPQEGWLALHDPMPHAVRPGTARQSSHPSPLDERSLGAFASTSGSYSSSLPGLTLELFAEKDAQLKCEHLPCPGSTAGCG